jgi:hypothetical protein
MNHGSKLRWWHGSIWDEPKVASRQTDLPNRMAVCQEHYTILRTREMVADSHEGGAK